MKNTWVHTIWFVASMVVVLAACGQSNSSDDGTTTPTTQATGTTQSIPPSLLAQTPEATEPNTIPDAESDVRVVADSEAVAVDYLTFAQGAVPISIGGTGAGLGATFEHAVKIIDGHPGSFTIISKADSTTDTEFVYELPALTTFERFAVPGIGETPSPSQTFTKHVKVLGSTEGPDGGWDLLASGTLETHDARGMVTEIPVQSTTPVRWVKVRLVGGIEILREQSIFQFREVIGNGSQETPSLAEYFTGIWDPPGKPIELKQDGATVTGCYDGKAELSGTVTGNVVRARGISPDDEVISLFILTVVGDSLLRGVRSTNGAPFRLLSGPTAPEGTITGCTEIPEPELGCGSIIHGINFDFDSAAIRPDSEPVLAELFEGLQADPSATIAIEGHTSSEGPDAYNQNLSERRAQSVVDDLVRRGLGAGRLTAVGKGEAEPIASNNDESGRSLNRRVEVVCK